MCEAWEAVKSAFKIYQEVLADCLAGNVCYLREAGGLSGTRSCSGLRRGGTASNPRAGPDAAGKNADGVLLGPWDQTLAPGASC